MTASFTTTDMSQGGDVASIANGNGFEQALHDEMANHGPLASATLGGLEVNVEGVGNLDNVFPYPIIFLLKGLPFKKQNFR